MNDAINGTPAKSEKRGTPEQPSELRLPTPTEVGIALALVVAGVAVFSALTAEDPASS